MSCLGSLILFVAVLPLILAVTLMVLISVASVGISLLFDLVRLLF